MSVKGISNKGKYLEMDFRKLISLLINVFQTINKPRDKKIKIPGE